MVTSEADLLANTRVMVTPRHAADIGIVMPFASHLDGEIEYFVEGSGPALVLLHGIANDASMWDDLGYLEALRPYFTVIRVNCRGYGNSTPVTRIEHLPYELYRDDCLAVLDAVGVDQATFMGYSRGGMLSLAFATEYPERVRALVVGAANLRGGPPARQVGPAAPAGRGRSRLHPRRIAGAIRRRIKQRFLGAEPTSAGPMSRWQPVLQREGISYREAWDRFIRPVADLDRVTERLTMPTLFFQGDHDAMFDVGETVSLVSRLQQAELEVIPGGTHDLVSQSERVLPAIMPFVLRTAGLDRTPVEADS